MCDLYSNYQRQEFADRLRSIFVETIVPSLRQDARCKDLADAIVGIEIEQDTVILKLNRAVRMNGDLIGRNLRGLHIDFSLMPTGCNEGNHKSE